MDQLSEGSGIPRDRLSSMALQPCDYRHMPLPLVIKARRAASTWLQFCPACLDSDQPPYFRRGWRHSTRISCFIHRCGLRDRCHRATAELLPSLSHGLSASMSAPLALMTAAGIQVPVTIEAQYFEQIINRSIGTVANILATNNPPKWPWRKDLIAVLPTMSVSSGYACSSASSRRRLLDEGFVLPFGGSADYER